mmetsp:Transcript_104929/g.197721  ORF Transcript_104929/g.197721 Transcript_104929/m.197721 type:complete len:223 (-) Transcript_104929:31-699(-)
MADEITVEPGDIKREGFLLKKSKVLKSWHKRWFVLTPQYLIAFKFENDRRQVTEYIRLTDCSTVKPSDDETGKENSFSVVTPKRTFFLIASSANEREVWIQAVMHSLPLAAQLSQGGSPRLPLCAITEDVDASESGSSYQGDGSGLSMRLAQIGNQSFPINQQCFLCGPESLFEPCTLCDRTPAYCAFMSTLKFMMPQVKDMPQSRRPSAATDLVRNALLDL